MVEPPDPALLGAVVPVAGTAFAEVTGGHRHTLVEDLGKQAAWPVDLNAGQSLLRGCPSAAPSSACSR